MNISENLKRLKKSINQEKVKLVAVSKTKPNEAIIAAFEAGQLFFGENRVQELVEKQKTLPKEIEWHFIGHLQSKKVKSIASFVNLIHAVESFKLLEIINKEANKHNRIIECLLQIYIAEENTKYGLTKEEAIEILENPKLKDLQNIKIKGLMGMATFTENENQIRNEFEYLQSVFIEFKNKYQTQNINFQELSMGMSGDYKIAIDCGSTMIRVGSTIFGPRNY